VASSESFIVEQGYHDFLYKQVIATVKNGNPVMIGVKNNPDMNINWTWDHALLVVGYNEITDELIYNDFNNRKRMPAGQLITKDGRI
jgi:hypothetical protein